MLFFFEEFLLVAGILGCVAAFVCLMVRLFNRKYQGEWRRDIWMSLFAWYLTFLLIVELAPVPMMYGKINGGYASLGEFWQAPEIPLFHFLEWQYSFDLPMSLTDVFAYRYEMLLFVPFGFFLPLLWDEMNPKAVPLGLYVVTGIEVLQLLFGRVFDAGDIIMEFLAVFIGYGLYFGFSYVFPKAAKKIVKSKSRW